LTAGSTAAGPRDQAAGAGLIAGGAVGMLAIGCGLLAALVGVGGASLSTASQDLGGSASGVSALAEREIPPLYLRLYQQAAQRFGLDWAILAGVGRVECDHGLDPDPSCTKEGAVNPAGAGGPMQFIASTWTTYGVDGDGDGNVNRWDPADAIFSAANYLRASGAPTDYRRAIFSYNHSSSYVTDVLGWASRYRGGSTVARTSLIGGQAAEVAALAQGFAGQSSTPVRFVAGDRAMLDPEDGHLALVPTGVPATVQAMVVAGNELQELPYGPSGHPDPRGAVEEDCSSTINYVLYRAGIRPIAEIVRENPLAQDYVSWGAPGPGLWVTIYATTQPTDHVFAVIAGLRLDTSHDGTDVGPNRAEDGPRWRILDHIPTWARWSIRHPPGL
jgi:hypothetical protein